MADYYHHKFYGRKTASGEVLEKDRLTAAHRTLPFGTRLKVTNKRNGTSCIVVINDRGPFTSGKVIDLSHAAARKLGVLSAGTALVACRVVDKDEVDESNNDED
jgi:rare lipoprotein A